MVPEPVLQSLVTAAGFYTLTAHALYTEAERHLSAFRNVAVVTS